MVFSRYPLELKKNDQSQTYRPEPPDSQLVWKKADDQLRASDKELLDTGYMSDCTVICGDSNWTAHKSILCSRNDWFRETLTGAVEVKLTPCLTVYWSLVNRVFALLQEGSPGVVVIENTNPDVVQIVLEAIYTGEINFYCSTPCEVVQVWKAGDFFGIHDLRWEAEKAMFRRLRASAEFLNFNPKPNTKAREDRHCKAKTVGHHLCSHFTRETRVCPVSARRSEGDAVFHVEEPLRVEWLYNTCDLCEKRMTGERNLDDNLSGLRDAADQHSRRYEPPAESPEPDDEIRELIMSEIEGLCEALNLVVGGPTKGSSIHEALINHVCNTPVAAWWGFTVCKFLLKNGPPRKTKKNRFLGAPF